MYRRRISAYTVGFASYPRFLVIVSARIPVVYLTIALHALILIIPDPFISAVSFSARGGKPQAARASHPKACIFYAVFRFRFSLNIARLGSRGDFKSGAKGFSAHSRVIEFSARGCVCAARADTAGGFGFGAHGELSTHGRGSLWDARRAERRVKAVPSMWTAITPIPQTCTCSDAGSCCIWYIWLHSAPMGEWKPSVT
ncbi:hypothetical protein B0H19DRAFT_1076554 [Mycena capillaripes]|nr:hypothetical protein B0H19DRAFT_1076554 [Mycena capillaripes]